MVRAFGCGLFVVYLLLRALPSLRFQVSNQMVPPVLFAHSARLPQRQTDERRTAHRETHQGRTDTTGEKHHMACHAAWLFAAKRLQDFQPQVDLYRFATQNQRLVGLRFLQMLLGLSEQQEKRMNSCWLCTFRVFRFWKPYHLA